MIVRSSLIERVKRNPRQPNMCGLRSSTKSEIAELIKTLEKLGAHVEHVTHHKDKTKLPFNGMLLINQKERVK